MNIKVERKIEETYQHIKPYMPTQELIEMCKICEAWNGEEHDYSECRNKMCFKCWLALEYMIWSTSYE